MPLRFAALPLLVCTTLAQAPTPAATADTHPVRAAAAERSAVDRLLATAIGDAATATAMTTVIARKTGRAGPPLAAITAVLGPHDAVVEFVVWRGPQQEQLTAFVLLPDRPVRRIDDFDLPVLRQALATHLQLLARATGPLDPKSQQLARSAAQRLRSLVLDPVADAIADRHRVWFCADGDLMQLPFDSLPARHSDTLLIETIDVRHLACCSELVAAPRAATGSLLVIDDGTLALPEASREARGIALAWERARRGPVLQRRPDEAVTATDLRSCEFLHLASLAPLQLPTTARRGPVVRAVDAAAGSRSAARLDLTCRLAVLSVCDVGDDATGERSPVGLRAHLRACGARSSLTLQWPLEGALVRERMHAFWRELILCDDPALALRRVKLACIEANRTACGDALPGTWAGLLLDGHGTP